MVFFVGYFFVVYNKMIFNDNLDGSILKVGIYNKGLGFLSFGIIVFCGLFLFGIVFCVFLEILSFVK